MLRKEREETEWDFEGFDDKAHRTLKAQMNTFSINEIQGTEADNDLAINPKVQ